MKYWRSVAAIAFALAFALPWAKTGNHTRSGYSLASVLHEIDIVGNRFADVVIVCVLAMPLFAAATVAADATGAARAATASLTATTVLAGGCALAVGFGRGIGPWFVAGTVVLVVTALFMRRSAA